MNTQTTQPAEKHREFGFVLSCASIFVGFVLLCFLAPVGIFLIMMGTLGVVYTLGDHEYHAMGLVLVALVGFTKIPILYMLDEPSGYTIASILCLGLAMLLSPTKDHFLQGVVVLLALFGLGALAT